MADDPKKPGGIMERWRRLLEEAEAEAEEEVEDELVVRAYEVVLGELKFNSKPIITDLTIIAGQHQQLAADIAHAICSRIAKVAVDQKLPSLYLLDSIVKNIGGDYVRQFAARLPQVFCDAYKQVHPSQYTAMRHLFGTWSQVFPSSVLRRIEDELEFSPLEKQRPAAVANMRHSESPSPRLSHGIHVNPSFVEGRQFKHSAVMHPTTTRDNMQTGDSEAEQVEGFTSESPRGWSTMSPNVHQGKEAYAQRSSMQYGEKFDLPDVLPPLVARASSPRISSMHPPSILNIEGTRRNMARPLSPLDRIPRGSSPKRVIERPSPSQHGFAHGLGRPYDQNGLIERNWVSDDGVWQPEPSILGNGYRKQNARELIDAYGNHRGEGASHERFPKVQRLDTNGMANDSARRWISSEEEEYSWEDMSPTLADQSRRNSMSSSVSNSRTLSTVTGFPRHGLRDSGLGRHSWPGQAPRPAVGDLPLNFEERPGGVPNDRKYPGSFGIRNDELQYYQSSHRARDAARVPNILPQPLQHNIGPLLRLQAPLIPSTINRTPLPPDNDMPFRLLPSVPHDPLNADASILEKQYARRAPSPAPVEWPPLHTTYQQTSQPIPVDPKHIRGQVNVTESMRLFVNQEPNSSVFVPRFQYDAMDRNALNTSNSTQSPYQHAGTLPLGQSNQEAATRNHPPQEVFRSFVPNMPVVQPQKPLQVRGHGPAIALRSGSVAGAPASVQSSALPVPHPAGPSYDMPPIHDGGVLPPLPLGPPPVALQTGPGSQIGGPQMPNSSSTAFSGLLNTLMARGVISLRPNQSQDSIGVEFNADLLKVRHDSAINALYMDLPRQCTTCGLRFKSQEEHRTHMDWHVTKNRISKNRKQKPSRKWFVNAKEWLDGAEILGNDVVPGFLTTEPSSDKKEEKEMAVPADEDQTVCALCAEPFEDFYSDETEEWMYKGAVYMNAPDGNYDGLERSHLGPIVHAKCRSGSNDASGLG